MRRAWLLLALLAPAVASAAPSYYGWGAGAFLQGPEAEDTTAPTVIAARIDGAVLTVSYGEAVTHGAGGTGGVALVCSGGAVIPTFASGAGSSQLSYTLSRAVLESETCTMNYTQPINGIEDIAGNDLATFSGRPVAVQGGCVQLLGPSVYPVVGPSVIALQCVQ